MTDIENLCAIEAIKQLKARYFRCVDSKNWIAYAELFAPDIRFDIGDASPDGVLESPQAVVDVAKAGLADCVSVHHGHGPEIVINSETTAEGVWAMEDVLCWNDGAASPIRTLHGYGHYFETYRKIDGQWRIQTLRLTRLRVDTTSWEGAR